MSKRRLAVCVVAFVLAATAGCEKSTGGNGVASADGSARPNPTQSLRGIELARRHAQCMREHGVPEPDPQIQADGSIGIGGGDYDKSSIDADTLSLAQAACRQHDPIRNGPDYDRKVAGMREYSRCMRANGVEDFPDPNPDGSIRLPQEQTDPDYDQAEQTCDGLARSNPGSATASR